jgi:hypothetical protein
MKFMQRKMKHFMTAWARLVGFGLPGVWASQLASLWGEKKPGLRWWSLELRGPQRRMYGCVNIACSRR